MRVKQAFDILSWVGTEAPFVLLFILANGLLAPGLYAALNKLPFDLAVVRRQIRSGDRWAVYAWCSWLLFALVASLVLLLVLGGAVSTFLI